MNVHSSYKVQRLEGGCSAGKVLVLTFMTPELHILAILLLRSDTGYTCDTRPTIPELATFIGCHKHRK